MPTEEELDSHIADLARLGRVRDFSPGTFDQALLNASPRAARGHLLRRLLLEWTGVGVGEAEAPEIWDRVLALHGQLRESLGAPVSLQTALLHEFHSKLGLLREPRLLADRDLSSLRVSAITDPLTGLYNRRFMVDHLSRELSRAERLGGVVSLLFMDLQGFKAINDRLGHPVGDGVLMKTANLIRDSLRMIDAGCRYGGDEFVAVLPNTDMVNSLAIAERIRHRVAQIRLPRRADVKVGLHYGVASYPTDGRTLDFLIKMGDLRLYHCRQQYVKKPAGHPGRRHPRFAVQGLTLKLEGARNARQRALEVRDIGYGGLAFVNDTGRQPRRLEGELAQQFSSDVHHVSMRPVSVVPLPDGRTRVGCAFDQ
jgi:diguanylate cyclase (GGDEF)-like protein